MWSPDGKALAYFTSDQLRRVTLDGGSPVLICELKSGVYQAGSWGTDGIVFTSVQEYTLYRVAPAGGAPEVLLAADPAEGRPVWPTYLPDGKTLLYLLIEPDGNGQLMWWRDGQRPRAAGRIASRVGYVEPGFLVFVREGVLVAQPFDAVRGRLSGVPFALAPGIPYFLSTFWAEFAASPSGTVVYGSRPAVSRLAWFDRSGRELAGVGEPGAYLDVRLSPDERTLLFDRALPSLGTYDVWSLDLERGIETRLTSMPLTEAFPLMLPDEQTLIYSVAEGGAPALVRRDPSTGALTRLVSSGGFEMGEDVSSDGRWLAFRIRQAGEGFVLWLLDLTADRPPVRLLPGDFGQWSASFSPDGSYLAFVSSESGTPEAYVMPRGVPSERMRISSQGATRAVWGAKGSKVYVLSPSGTMSAIEVHTSPSLRIGAPEELFEVAPSSIVRETGRASWLDFDVASDGRFIAIVPGSSDETPPLSVMVGAVATEHAP
jgi:eukaryotic-like serine/threonine-protein kinase